MKRLIYIILLVIPAFCWGQGINVVHMPTRPVFVVAAAGGLGSEEISNGTFDSNLTGWNGINWAWQTGGGGGWARHSTGSAGSLYQSTGVSLTVTYRVVFTVDGLTAGSVRPRVGSSGWGTARSSNGTYEEDITCAGNTIFYIGTVSEFDGYVDDISVKEVL